MSLFGDRTLEFSQMARSFRNQTPQPQIKKRRNPNIAAKINLNSLAAEIGKDTHATAQKLKELTRRKIIFLKFYFDIFLVKVVSNVTHDMI